MKSIKSILIVLSVLICLPFTISAQQSKDSIAVIISVNEAKTRKDLAVDLIKNVDGILKVEQPYKTNKLIVFCVDSTAYSKTSEVVKKNKATLSKYEIVQDTQKPKPIIVPIVKDTKDTTDELLNVTDISIFTNPEIMEIDTIRLHPRSKDYCLLIRLIAELNSLLQSVENLKLGQKDEAKAKLSQANELIDTINATSKCYTRALSIEQKDFYNTVLIPKFNTLWGDVY